MDIPDEIEPEQLKAALRANEVCLTDEELGGLLDDSLGEQAHYRVESHLAACPRCATELSLLREFRSIVPRPEEAEAVHRIARRLQSRVSAILGADSRRAAALEQASPFSWWSLVFSPRYLYTGSLMLVLAIFFVGRPPKPTLPPDLGRQPTMQRSQELQKLEIIGPEGEWSQVPRELSWRAVPDAVQYEVLLKEVDGTELWRTEAAQTHSALPAKVRARIVPRKTLLWQVTAQNASGFQIAASGVHRFRVVHSLALE